MSAMPSRRTIIYISILGCALVSLIFVFSHGKAKSTPARNDSGRFNQSMPVRNKPAPRDEAATQRLEPDQPQSTSVETSPPFSGAQIETARHIMDFIRTGDMKEIRDLPREDVEELISIYLSKVPMAKVAASLEKYLGVPPAIFFSASNPKDYLMDIFDVAREDVEKPQIPSNLIFTDSCATDGSVLGAVHIIPEGASSVYAVFENQGLLQGMGQVYAIWRDLNDDSMQFSEYEPLRVDTHYNYVWLKLDEGWSEGYYQLDLVDPAKPSRILASSKFKVKQMSEIGDENKN